jgi:hypothetical protein
MNIAEQLRSITPQDFAQMGVQQVAYVRPAVVNGADVFTIHAADGTQIGIAPTRDIAFAAVKQHELEPVSVQ